MFRARLTVYAVGILLLTLLGTAGHAITLPQEGAAQRVKEDDKSLKPPPLSIFTESRMWPTMYMMDEISDPIKKEELVKLIEQFKGIDEVFKKTDESMERLGFGDPEGIEETGGLVQDTVPG